MWPGACEVTTLFFAFANFILSSHVNEVQIWSEARSVGSRLFFEFVNFILSFRFNDIQIANDVTPVLHRHHAFCPHKSSYKWFINQSSHMYQILHYQFLTTGSYYSVLYGCSQHGRLICKFKFKILIVHLNSVAF